MTQQTPQQTPQEQEPQVVHARRRTSPILILLAGIIPAAIVVAALWFVWVKRPNEQTRETAAETARRTLGLATPARNSMDARFADANSDLIPDPPSEAAKFVDPPKLFFSYVALEDPAPYQAAFKDFLDHLSKVTGKPVEYLPVTNTNDQLKALRDGNLHVTGFNTGSVPIAVYLCGFVPVCKLATPDGNATLQTQIIVPADSPIKSIEDLRGRELTLTEPNSNAGYKAPVILLRDRGLEPACEHQIGWLSMGCKVGGCAAPVFALAIWLDDEGEQAAG